MRPRARSFELPPLAHSKPEAAFRAGVGLSTIKEAVKNGELAEVEIGGRRLVLDEDLHQWLLRHRVVRGNGLIGDTPPGEIRAPEPPPSRPQEASNDPPPRRR